MDIDVAIVGSGLSCAEGILGMKALSKKLLEDAPNKLQKSLLIIILGKWGRR